MTQNSKEKILNGTLYTYLYLTSFFTTYLSLRMFNSIIFSNYKELEKIKFFNVSSESIPIFPELKNIAKLYSFNNSLEIIYISQLFEKLIFFTLLPCLIFLIEKKFNYKLFLPHIVFFTTLYFVNSNPMIFIFLIVLFVEKIDKNKYNIFLISLIIYSIYLWITFPKFFNQFAFSELIINYSGGFVRRGFLGSILGNLGSAEIFYYFSILIFYLFLFLYTKFLSYQKNYIEALFFLYNPLTLGYIIKTYVPLYGRKDFLILIFILLVSNEIRNRKNFSQIKQIYYIILLSLVVLTYELIIFFIPFYLIKILNKYKKENIKKLYISIFGLIFNFLLGISLIINFAKVPDFSKLCSSLILKFGESVNYCSYAPQYLSFERNYYRNEVISQITTTKIYYWLFLIVILLISNYLFFEKKEIIQNGLLFFFLLPVFYFAQDWGRWIYLIFFHQIIFSTPRFRFSERSLKIVTSISIAVVLYFSHYHCMCSDVSLNIGFGITNIIPSN